MDGFLQQVKIKRAYGQLYDENFDFQNYLVLTQEQLQVDCEQPLVQGSEQPGSDGKEGSEEK